jgi:hypothetical protein
MAEEENIVIGKFDSLKIKYKCIEGWASFYPQTVK